MTAGKWHHVGVVRPQPTVPIEIDWLGTVFEARFIKVFAPWVNAWHVDINYFSGWTHKLITTNQINRWRYASPSDQEVEMS